MNPPGHPGRSTNGPTRSDPSKRVSWSNKLEEMATRRSKAYPLAVVIGGIAR